MAPGGLAPHTPSLQNKRIPFAVDSMLSDADLVVPDDEYVLERHEVLVVVLESPPQLAVRRRPDVSDQEHSDPGEHTDPPDHATDRGSVRALRHS